MKSCKHEETPLRAFAQTVQKSKLRASHEHLIRKPQSSLASLEKSFIHPSEETYKFIHLYKSLLVNLREHKMKVHGLLNQQAAKNDTFFLELIKGIEDIRQKTQKWMEDQISQANEKFNKVFLDIQIRVYQLKKDEKINISQQMTQYEKMKAIEIPAFCYIPCQALSLEKVLNELSTVVQRKNPYQKKVQPQQNQCLKPNIQPPKQKNIPDIDQCELQCDQSLNFNGQGADLNHHKTYISPYDIIMQQSESQESSLISTTDFI